jgi:imidazolonepropionase-like amidohydrolase
MMKTSKVLRAACCVLTAHAGVAGAQQTSASAGDVARSPQHAARSVLIRNATVLTVTKGTLPNTDILVENGKIARVAQNITPPAGVQVIDGSGKYVMPGIIDAHSHMMSDAINEGSLSVTSMTRITDVLNPTAPNIYRALAGGVTTINILHGSANTIGGQSATVKLKHGRPVSEMVFPGAPPGIKFALGENVTRKNSTVQQGQQRRYPATRMGQEEVIRDAFTRARDYKAAWDEHRARVARGDRNAVPPRRDLELEPLVEILEGKRLVHAHSYRADEIHMLLKVAEEFGFKVRSLQHVLEGYKVAPEIAKHGAGASTFADSWSYKIEAYDAIPHNVAIMTRAGVISTVNSDSDERVRRMNIEAAKMMRYGDLTEEEALKTITWNAAWQLGVEDRVGSIEVGKDADLAIWNGHPFSVYSNVETTLIDGEIFFDKQRDLAMREARQRERAELERASANQPARERERPRPAEPVVPDGGMKR